MDLKETCILQAEFFTSPYYKISRKFAQRPYYKISRKFAQRGLSFSKQTDG